jgi:hypothetical protein
MIRIEEMELQLKSKESEIKELREVKREIVEILP